MNIDKSELIQTFITHPKEQVTDDGRGNFNISPLSFPSINRSGFNNPTLFVPHFGIDRSKVIDININVLLSGLQGYSDGQIVNLLNQTNSSENGKYIVHEGVWEKYVLYTYDGTENDNKEGLYSTNVDHYRKGYSHTEVVDYLRDRLNTSLSFGQFHGKENANNGALVKWLTTSGKINIGGAASKSVEIDAFNSKIAKERIEYPLNINDSIQSLRTIKSIENKYAKWSLSNHHTEAVHGRDKSPFVRDYPFNYNSSYEDIIFSGGRSPLEAHVDDWRMTINGHLYQLRLFAEECLFYQRDNSYHNNITVDMSRGQMFGRQHISMLNTLNRDDYAPDANIIYGDGTAYEKYSNNIVADELDAVSLITFSGKSLIKKQTTNNITKYYYTPRKKDSISLIEKTPTSIWTPSVILWEPNGDNAINIYLTSSDYITLSNGDNDVSWLVNTLSEHNQLIPSLIDENNLKVLFIDNSLVDYANDKSSRVRSKKTFVHLPTPIGLLDGQQFELDVSLPMMSDETPFNFNTTGALAGYMNYISQPRVYVLSGTQTCYSRDSYLSSVVIYESIELVNSKLVVSGEHFITDSTFFVKINNKTYSGTVVNSTTLLIDANIDPSNLTITRIVKLSSWLPTVTVNDDIATISCSIQHNIHNAEDIIISFTSDQFSGDVFGYVTDDKTIIFDTTETNYTSFAIQKVIVAHSNSFYHSTPLALPKCLSISAVNGNVTVLFESSLKQTINSNVVFTITDSDVLSFNGEYNAIITNSNEIQFYKSGLNGSITTYKIYATMKVSEHGIGVTRTLGGEGVEGLTERNNDYLYSVMPEVEFATAKNKYHQRHMTISDINSSDKRVLLATVYPTSLNTFSWILGNNPQNSLLRNSHLAFTSMSGSAADVGYESLARAFSSISTGLGSAGMSLYDSPLVYDNTIPLNTSHSHFLSNRIHVLMHEHIIPSENEILSSDEAKTYGSLVHQLRSGYNECLDAYYAGRVRVGNQQSSDYSVGFNGNAVNVTDVNKLSSFAQCLHENSIAESTVMNNDRWLTKGLYVSEFSTTLKGVINQVDLDVFSNTNSNFINYLSYNFYGDTKEVNAGSRYIPNQLNSPYNKKFKFGVGNRNSVLAYLDNINAAESLKNDFIMKMSDLSFTIPNNLRTLNDRFSIDNMTNMDKFYGLANMPYVNIISLGVNYPLFDMSNMTGLSNISNDMKDAICAINPYIANYISGESYSIHINKKGRYSEYIRNTIPYYACKSPLRMYNSWRTLLSGNNSSLEATDDESKIIFDTFVDYVDNFISLPSSIYPRYVDDSIALNVNTDSVVTVIDNNDSWLKIKSQGKSATAKIKIGNVSIIGGTLTINGITLTASDDENCVSPAFYAIGDAVDIASRIVRVINKEVASIFSHNYEGNSHEILLVADRSLGASGNSIVISTNINGLDIVGFSGGMNPVNGVETNFQSTSHPMMASNDAIMKKLDGAYVRVKMRFVFSSQCGRWLTMDYRQSPITYLTPSIGNEALSAKERSIVKYGTNGTQVNDYIAVTESTKDSVTNTDYIWSVCQKKDAFKDLWCADYSDMNALEFNRFVLPFMSNKFPYDDSGKLLTNDYKGGVGDQHDYQLYRFDRLLDPVSNIRLITPNNIHGGKVINGIDTANFGLNMLQPNLWSVYWHKRPASTMVDADIPSKSSRINGSYSDPALFNMYSFPCKYSFSYKPCYLIPWHENMNYDWLLNTQPSIDSAIVNDEKRMDKMTYDAIMKDYDWVNETTPIDPTRSDFMIIDSDRIDI